MGLAVFNGQIYPIWAGNLNKGHIVNGAVQGPFLSIFYQPMVIADGPRIVSSDMGPISLADAQSGSVSFTVTFDRPIDPPSLNGYTTTPTFTPADVLVYYHDTTNGDASGSAAGDERDAGRRERSWAGKPVWLHAIPGDVRFRAQRCQSGDIQLYGNV